MREGNKRVVRRVLPMAFALCLLIWAAGARPAGATDAQYWAHIRKADARVRSSQVSWRVLITLKPNPTIDIEKGVAAWEEQERNRGSDANEIKNGSVATRQSLQMCRDGYSTPEQVEFKDDGKVTRCEIVAGDLVGPSVPKADPATRAHFVDIYDGTNSITLRGVGAVTPTSGSLTRGPVSHALQNGNTYFGKLIFLAGVPITRFFSPADTAITDGGRGVITLEKHPGGKDAPFVRLAVSKANWRPVTLTMISPFTGHSLSTCTLKGCRSIGGTAFPAAFFVVATTESGAVYAASEYHLISAAFNEEADVSDLKFVVPAGTSLDDFRFGYSTPQYQVGDHVPTDDEVRKTIAHFETKTVQDRRNFLWLPALGALSIGFGAFLLMRRYRAKKGIA